MVIEKFDKTGDLEMVIEKFEKTGHQLTENLQQKVMNDQDEKLSQVTHSTGKRETTQILRFPDFNPKID